MSAIYRGLWLLVILGLVIVMDWMLPIYGFTQERATWVWRAIQLGVGATTLLLSLFLLVQSAIYAHSNQPTNQLGHQPTANQLDQPGQPTVLVEPTDQPTFLPPPNYGPEPADLSDAVKRSVYALAREGTTKAAAARLGLTDEAVRKNVKKARDVAPDWVATVLEE